MDKPDLNRYYHWVAQDPDYREVEIRIKGMVMVFPHRRGENPMYLSVWATDHRRGGVGGPVFERDEDIDQRLAELRQSDVLALERRLEQMREGTG